MIIKSQKIMKIELFILLLLGISHIFFGPTINLLLSIILFFLFLFTSLENNIVMLFTALPFFNLFTGKIGTTSLYYLYIIIFIFKYFFRSKTINGKKILLFILLILLRLSSADYVALAKWALLISIPIFSYKENFLYKQIPTIVKYFTLSFILSSFIGYYMLQNNLSIYTKSYIYLSENHIVTRFAGLVGDSVFYAQFASILIAANLVLNYYINEFKFNRYIQILIMMTFVILTYSKTGIILIVLAFFLYFILVSLKNGKSKKTILFLFLLLVVSILTVTMGLDFILKNSSNTIINNYLLRFSSADLWTGRNAITNHYVELLSNRWTSLFVAMPYKEYLAPFTTNGISILNKCHNIYIETICAFGMIPTVCMFLWMFVKMLKTIMRKDSRIGILPMILLLASGLSLHGHFEFHYYGILAIALAMLNEKTFEILKSIKS